MHINHMYNYVHIYIYILSYRDPENRKISQVRHIDSFLFSHVSILNESQGHLFRECRFLCPLVWCNPSGRQKLLIQSLKPGIGKQDAHFHLSFQNGQNYESLKLSFHSPRTHIPSHSPYLSWLKLLNNSIYTSYSDFPRYFAYFFHIFPYVWMVSDGF